MRIWYLRRRALRPYGIPGARVRGRWHGAVQPQGI